ncbi:MAG: nitrogen regulation protein NR(I) [Parvibaculum sp.]|nr:nitrogen regulation protein NR(I) [Parvibaculum sp.]
MPSGTILLADDDAAIRTVLNQALGRVGYEVRSTGNAATLWRWVSQGEGDLIITDVVMPDENAFDLIPRIKRARPDLPIVVMSAQNTLKTAIMAAERGAYEYLPKPFDLNELIRVVDRAMTAPREPAIARQQPEEGEKIPLIGRSPAMQDIYRVLARLMQTDLTVMISGESGTGKELVARALHDYGRRRNGPFVAVNMAAIPRELIESELFGHEKGAFTGASDKHAGKFQEASGGTLFLDEIGELPLDIQVKLLRALQQGEVDPVGSKKPVKVDIRLISATNRDMLQMVKEGRFREDLYYRLNVFPIHVPPLRERKDDIPELVAHFIRRLAAEEGKPVVGISSDALSMLRAYDWPGNVRQVENTVFRAIVLCDDEMLQVSDFPQIASMVDGYQEAAMPRAATAYAPHTSHPAAGGAAEPGSVYLPQQAQPQPQNHTLEDFARSNFSDGIAITDEAGNVRKLEEIEAEMIRLAIDKYKGHMTEVARRLGIGRSTLYRKVREQGLEGVLKDAC